MFNYKTGPEYKKEKILKCDHKWKSTQLIFSTVQDCELCEVKKEEWEETYSKEAVIKEEHGWKYGGFFV